MMKGIVTERGLAFNATKFISLYGKEYFIKLQKRYIVKTKNKVTNIPQITKLYNLIKCNDNTIIEFPRYTVYRLLSDIPTYLSPITKLEIDLPIHSQISHINYSGKSNPNQAIVVNHVINNVFSNDIGGCTIKVMAGCGKSFIAMDIIGKMKLKTLIVVPNTYLLDQWVKLLNTYFKDSSIGVLYGKEKKDGDIIVGIINTISDLNEFTISQKKPIPYVGKSIKYIKHNINVKMDDILKTVGLVIFDESQLYVSKQFKKAFQRIWARYTIGLSATPDIREDKLDIIHQLSLGSIVDAESLDGYETTQDSFQSDCHLVNYHALNEHCKFNIRDDGMIDYSSIVQSIITDNNRNQLICDEVIKLMTKGHYIFVFSDRRSHLEHLYELIESQCAELHKDALLSMPESDKKVILYGGSKEETIQKAKTLSNVIFTTYAYSSTGVSITKMDALVLTTPRRTNMKQIINRIFRLGSDQNIKRTIIDIVDAKMPVKQQIRERIKAYQERGCCISKRVFEAKI